MGRGHRQPTDVGSSTPPKHHTKTLGRQASQESNSSHPGNHTQAESPILPKAGIELETSGVKPGGASLPAELGITCFNILHNISFLVLVYIMSINRCIHIS